MSWTVLVCIVVVLGLALALTLLRRAELRRMERAIRTRERAVRQGSAAAQLQHPVVDLSRCLGCATCVAVCPEDGVLELVHGQAMVVNGARCAGVAACERECPVGAITVTISKLEERTDVPVVDENLEAVGAPGLFLAGEVTAHALIKTAIEHGTAVADEVCSRIEAEPPAEADVLDLCIVGAGPAGLACALEAKRRGLRFLVLEQEEHLGGTVAKYPRRKLVITQPVDLPLHGRLRSASYTKEDLIELWQGIAEEHELPVQGGQVLEAVDRDPAGGFVVRTRDHAFRARFVCLAIGRRGSPRRLGVPGEHLPKVAYALLDANSYQGRRVLVVGGGDAAAETALALAEQPGNDVVISYRKEGFFRVRAINEQRLEEAIAQRRLRVLLRSEVAAIHEDHVDLVVHQTEAAEAAEAAAGARDPAPAARAETALLERARRIRVPNDDVFVMVGGTSPIQLLQRAGVSFDPKLRPPPAPLFEQGTGLARALGIGFALATLALLWALWHSDYYMLPAAERPAHEKHVLLRPGLGLGLGLGIAATVFVCVNLLYLVRRGARFGLRWGSLQAWMTSHVATGILALLCALLHGAMAPRDTPGGHAFWALVVLLVTGAVGRYFYACVPRAANGRELELGEVRARLARMSEEWDVGQRRFQERVRTEVLAIIEKKQWRTTFLGRALALLGMQRDVRRSLARLAEEGRREGVADEQIHEAVALARRAHRTALMAAHYEDLRAILATWRWLHRWVAALMVLLLAVHIVHALIYGAVLFEGKR
jgi:thioredoxin reductase